MRKIWLVFLVFEESVIILKMFKSLLELIRKIMMKLSVLI